MFLYRYLFFNFKTYSEFEEFVSDKFNKIFITGLVDSIGLMVYEGTQALNYVKNYASGTSQWDGFPIKVYQQ